MTTRSASGAAAPNEPPRKRQRFSPSANVNTDTNDVEVTDHTQNQNPTTVSDSASTPLDAAAVEKMKMTTTTTTEVENGTTLTTQTQTQSQIQPAVTTTTTVMNDALQAEREAAAGILHFVNSTNPGFAGVLKQRYSDFIVNEIALDGTVVYLEDDKASDEHKTPVKDNPLPETQTEIKPQAATDDPENSLESAGNEQEMPKEASKPEDGAAEPAQSTPAETFSISKEDEEVLEKYFGSDMKDELLKFHSKVLAKPYAKPAQFGSLLTDAITDRVLRGQIHQDVRRIFESRLETVSIEEGKISITAASKAVAAMHGRHGAPLAVKQLPRGRHLTQAKGKLGWQELGGEYLHFALYKENKDTMEVINFLSKQLRVKPRDFAFAGTKDRRAVTVQRVSVFRQHSKDLAKLNRSLRQARIGGFNYQKHKLELGELMGNQFIVALRDCHFDGEAGLDDAAKLQLANDVVSRAIAHIKVHGFINYFGLQRFGTFGIGTDVVGKLILKEDFEGAVKAILAYNDSPLPGADPNSRVGRDDLDRAKAIKAFETTGTSGEALRILPRKFSAETSIIRHLSMRDRASDYCNALLTVNRNLRTMYVHAYQSLVWNMAASERWSRYGDRVVEGDLVLVDSQKLTSEAKAAKDEVDENGEVVVHPAQDDAAVQHDDLFDRARPLSAEEAASGKYSIFDIVLPTPGWDIEYPGNDIGDFYKEFMGSERGGGLDPANMRRKQRDFSLSGSYRKIMAQMVQRLSFEVKTYHNETETLVETDLEKIEKANPQSQSSFGNRNQSSRNNTRDNQNGWHNGREARGGQNSNARGADNRNGRNAQSSNNNFSRSTNDSPSEPTAQLNAWQALPSKLAAEDKEAAAAAQYKYDNEPPIDPTSIRQPEYKETYIETIVDDSGRKTVGKTVNIVGTDGILRDVQGDSKATGTSNASSVAPVVESTAASTTTQSSFTEQQDGGAELPQGLSGKRSADQMLSNPATDSGHGSIAKAANTEFSSQDAAATSSDAIEQLGPAKLAVVITFALNSSQYATMALRELMKAGGVKTYKPDFSGGR